MDDFNSDPFYLFLHIPKTAGTTLRQIIDNQYGQENVLTYYNQNSHHLLDNLEALLIVKPQYKAIIGHYYFGFHSKFRFPATYITFLRHPVTRTISQYKEWLRNRPERLLNQDGSTQTLIENINSCPDDYTDFQCKHIAPGNNESEMSIGEQALHNLSNHFSGVGLVEYFDESISLFSEKFGWVLKPYNKLNVKNTEVDISAELIELILSINQNDLFLYENVKKQLLMEFEKQVK